MGSPLKPEPRTPPLERVAVLGVHLALGREVTEAAWPATARNLEAEDEVGIAINPIERRRVERACYGNDTAAAC